MEQIYSLIGKVIKLFQETEIYLYGIKYTVLNTQRVIKTDKLLSESIRDRIKKSINNNVGDDFTIILNYIKENRNFIVNNFYIDYDINKPVEREKAKKYLLSIIKELENIYNDMEMLLNKV